MEFNDGFPEYEKLAHHTVEAGVEKRKKLWKVFFILLVITIAELIVGFYTSNFSPLTLKIVFIGGTLVKAAYIVLSFMHLGEEVKNLRYVVLAPYLIFVGYLIFIALVEGVYSKEYKRELGKNIIEDSRNKSHDAHAEGAHTTTHTSTEHH